MNKPKPEKTMVCYRLHDGGILYRYRRTDGRYLWAVIAEKDSEYNPDKIAQWHESREAAIKEWEKF